MDDSLQEIHVIANNMRLDEDILEYFQTYHYVDPNQFIRECIDHFKEFHTIQRPSAPVPAEESLTINISQQELASWYREWQQFQTQRAQVLLILQGMNVPNIQELYDQYCTTSTFLFCDICHAPFSSKKSIALHKRKCKRPPEPENLFNIIDSDESSSTL